VQDVSALWQDARSWLARRDPFASETGSLIKAPPISGAVLAALQASPRLLHVLEWRAFERIIAQILESLGYEVELQRGTKDGGIDVIAVKEATEFGPHRYLLQAKRSRYKIGVEPVRELLFLKNEYQATKACLATTSSFTSGAWKLANEHRWELELRDFDRLREWLEMLQSHR
jgi:restriction system protein